MDWFGGSIAEAVKLTKEKNTIFVVYIEGNDESLEMEAIIEDPQVFSRLSDRNYFLSIKLTSGSSNYLHFAQIYKFVPVPSLFFIGRNGTPLEVVCAGMMPDCLANRIDRILAEHKLNKPLCPPSTSSSSHGIQEATVGLLQAEANASAPISIPGADRAPEVKTAVPAAPSPPKFPKPSVPATSPEAPVKSADRKSDHNAQYEVVCDGDVCVRRPKATDQPSTSQAVAPVAPVVAPVAPVTPVAAPVAPSVIAPAATLSTTSADKPPEVTASDTSVDQKVQRAKELMEAKRKEKAEKEMELERQRELERRNTGQGVAELKKWQADQEMKQIQEERKRAKLENDQARQRILEQIAQDRAERKVRDAPAPLPTPSPAQQQTTSHNATSGDAGTSARVQFKLPDGSSHTAHFDAAGTLGQVQRYVADNLQLSASSFALWTAFPRRELTDTSATLRELELAPSAALLVLPRRTQSPTAGPTQYFSVYAFISQLLTSYLYQPSIVLYTWIRTRLFPPPAVGPRPPTAPVPPTGVPPTTGAVPRAGILPRRRTNIHRLPGDSANDDDNNTWNGNSTQQM